MRGVATVLVAVAALVLVPGASAAPTDAPGAVVAAELAALARSDGRTACRLLSPRLLREVVPRLRPAERLRACVRSLPGELRSTGSSERRCADRSRRVTAVASAGARARVTVSARLYGQTTTGTAIAQREDGRWRVRELPSDERLGRELVLDVPSASMAPTLEPGDTIAVDPDAYGTSAPQDGDVVVVHPPRGADRDPRCGASRPEGAACARAIPGPPDEALYLKRVVAGPGEVVAFPDGLVVRSGVPVPEPYATPCSRARDPALVDGCDLPTPISVPAGSFVVLGDDRANSLDSRTFGPVPATAVVGRVRLLGRSPQ